jgi:hypothetical protein
MKQNYTGRLMENSGPDVTVQMVNYHVLTLLLKLVEKALAKVVITRVASLDNV